MRLHHFQTKSELFLILKYAKYQQDKRLIIVYLILFQQHVELKRRSINNKYNHNAFIKSLPLKLLARNEVYAISDLQIFVPSAGFHDVNQDPAPNEKSQLKKLAFGSFCWARTSDPLINSQML